MRRSKRPGTTAMLAAVACAAALAVSAAPAAADPSVTTTTDIGLGDVIPVPAEVTPDPDADYRLGPGTLIRTEPRRTRCGPSATSSPTHRPPPATHYRWSPHAATAAASHCSRRRGRRTRPRGIPTGRHQTRCHDPGQRTGGTFRRHPDAAPVTARRDRIRHTPAQDVDPARRPHRGPPPVRLPRRHARRRAPLPHA